MRAATYRAMTEADFEPVLALQQRVADHDRIPETPTMDELRQLLIVEGLVLADDTRLAITEAPGGEGAGPVVGFAQTFHLPSEVREERCYLFLAVEPSVRQAGVADDLLAWGIERATDQLNASPRSLPRFIRVDHFDWVDDARRLYERHGFTPVRYNEQLLRPLTDLPERHQPDGYQILGWPADRSDEIRLVSNAAFADHWGSTPTSPHNWETMNAGPHHRPDCSFVAVATEGPDEGAIVSFSLCSRYPEDDERLGRRDGWVDRVGTLRPHRGRGLVSALITHSLHAFAAARCTHAMIDVDADNPSGAARLYRSLGFEPLTLAITHQIELPGA